MRFKLNHRYLLRKVVTSLKFLCGVDNNDKVNRTNLWAMISTISTLVLLIIAYNQLREVNETTSAEFAHKIKNDLYSQHKIRLITLFDFRVLIFKSDSIENVWFELDSTKYKNLPSLDKSKNIPLKYNILEIDELLQDFEDLSFYENKKQLKIDYFYIQYVYYIETIWEDPQIQKYIKWQRSQAHNGYCYITLENMYTKIKAMSDKEP